VRLARVVDHPPAGTPPLRPRPAHRPGALRHDAFPLALLRDGRQSFDRNLRTLLERKHALMRDVLMPPAATDADRGGFLSASVAGA